MGVKVSITAWTPDLSLAKTACRRAFDLFERLDMTMTDYKPESELMRLCAFAGGGPIKVSSELFQVLSKSQEFAELSGGALDVTIGPLTKLWRAARASGFRPSDKEVAEAKRKTGFRNLALDKNRVSASLLLEGMSLDLGGIGKGYACDQALALMAKAGVSQALVEAGGDMAMSDPPPSEEGWHIGVEGVKEPLVLANCGVSTSGPSEQRLDAEGVRYSHVLDPRTGYGLTNHQQVTVVAQDAMTADGLSKICSILPESEWSQVQGSFQFSTVISNPACTT